MARLAAAASSVVARRIVVELIRHRTTDKSLESVNQQTDLSATDAALSFRIRSVLRQTCP